MLPVVNNLGQREGEGVWGQQERKGGPQNSLKKRASPQKEPMIRFVLTYVSDDFKMKKKYKEFFFYMEVFSRKYFCHTFFFSELKKKLSIHTFQTILRIFFSSKNLIGLFAEMPLSANLFQLWPLIQKHVGSRGATSVGGAGCGVRQGEATRP